MEIYRLENIYHMGPYIGAFICNAYLDSNTNTNKDLVDDHKNTRTKLNAIDDNIGKYDICGFATQDELKNWFGDEWYTILNDRGFYLAKYEVTNFTSHIDNQLVFNFTKAKLISKSHLYDNTKLISTIKKKKQFVKVADSFRCDAELCGWLESAKKEAVEV